MTSHALGIVEFCSGGGTATAAARAREGTRERSEKRIVMCVGCLISLKVKCSLGYRKPLTDEMDNKKRTEKIKLLYML